MICGLLLGREGSSGFPGKNIYPVLGRPLVIYPMVSAISAPSVSRLYVSTDSRALKEIGRSVGAEIIDRPDYLASKSALGEDAFRHGYQVIRDSLKHEGAELELLVLLFANAPTVTPEIIESGISALRANAEYDSAVSVSCYNMWSPLRARKINEEGLLDPFVPFETFGDPRTLNCDRDSQGDVWFADMGVSIVRPRCFEDMDSGLLPQKWMGRKIFPLKQWGGFDVDEPWQIPSVEYWLQAHQVERLFKSRRVRWEQLYDSERTVLSLLEIDPSTSVLDLGSDPGGMGLVMQERFGVARFTANVANEGEAVTIRSVNPAANICVGDPLKLLEGASEKYDLITALGTDDKVTCFPEICRKAFEALAPGGTLVFSLRLTEGATVVDGDRSYQWVSTGTGGREKELYVLRNVDEVLRVLKCLKPRRIFAYGYSGRPSSAAVTPFKTVCFCVFAITREADGVERTNPDIELRLPKQFSQTEIGA